VIAYPEEDLRKLIGIYYTMIAQVDDCVGRLLDALERTGQRENTIVVFTADHGDLVGEHAMTEKGGMLYDALVRVPLLLSWPGHLPERAIVNGAMASLVDLMPTLLWLLGLPVPPGMQGQPLAGILIQRFGLPQMESRRRPTGDGGRCAHPPTTARPAPRPDAAVRARGRGPPQDGAHGALEVCLRPARS